MLVYYLASAARYKLNWITGDYAAADVIVLATGNLDTHRPACLYERFEPVQTGDEE